LLTKLSGFFDLVRDTGGHLPKRRHLLRMDQARLRDLQLAERRFGCISRDANGFFGALPLSNVGIDQHETATGYWVPAHLHNAAVRPRPFEAHLPPDVFDGATQLRFKVGRVLAVVSEDNGNTRQSSAAPRGRRPADRASAGNCGSTRQGEPRHRT